MESLDKKTKARKWVHGYVAAGTAIVVAAVIPGATSAALCAMELHMCYQIGKIYRGDAYTLKEAAVAAQVVGLVAIAAQLVALEAMDFIPMAGWAVKGAVAAGVIKTLGEAIINHYEHGEKSAGNITAASVSTVTTLEVLPPQLETNAGFSPEKRLDKLNELLSKKLITPAEYEMKRQKILDEL